jgi:hypothetical protein
MPVQGIILRAIHERQHAPTLDRRRPQITQPHRSRSQPAAVVTNEASLGPPSHRVAVRASVQVADGWRLSPVRCWPQGIAATPRWAHAGCTAQRIVTVNDLLDGHVLLDIECLDRIYLNAYVPILQSSGQVVAFMTQHLGKPIPSPALMEHIGTWFRRSVESYASSNGIPWVRFGKDDRKADVMRPHIKAQAATGRRGWRRSGSRRCSSGCGRPISGTRGRRPRSTRSRRPTAGCPDTTSLGTKTSARRSSRSAPTSPTPPRSGSTGMSRPRAGAEIRHRVHRAVQRVRLPR